MTETRPTIFADGVIEAQVAHGVARVTLAVTGADGKAVPCATLCVPVTQLPAMVNGMGNLLKQIEERRRRLEAEGLFTAARKRPLPAMPRGIGLVTSPGAAALHDVVTAGVAGPDYRPLCAALHGRSRR